MYAVTVTLDVDATRSEAFHAALARNAARSLADEAGCHRFDVCWNADTPARLFLYELYTDRAAFEAHTATAHYKAFDAAVAGMVRAKDVVTYDTVTP